MKKILLLFIVSIFASLTSWANWVYLYSNPRAASTVYVGTDINLGYFSNGFTFAEANPGETVYFAFSAFDGYTLTGIRYQNLSSEDVTELPNGVYSFTMPDARVSINLDFDETPIVVTGVDITEENFPDANFRSWLLSQSYGTDGVITESEIRSITSIDARSCGIEDLTGIEHFKLLTQLIVSNDADTPQENMNRIAAINLSENTDLRKLDCEGNLLRNLDVTNIPNLQILFFANNQVNEIDLSKNTKLELLSCSGNQLTELNLSNNPLLAQLYCDNNQLMELDMSNKSSLQILNCYNNQLTSLDVSRCDDLFQIYFYNNQISGQAMDDFVNSLPERYGYMVVVDLDNEAEQNAMTKAQVAAAQALGWSVEGITGDDFVQYEGIDDVTFLRGDVNGDEDVTIADVTALIDYLLSGDASNISMQAADVNTDEDVTIADVTALIDYLLSGNWP